jgi:hypothetical protein
MLQIERHKNGVLRDDKCQTFAIALLLQLAALGFREVYAAVVMDETRPSVGLVYNLVRVTRPSRRGQGGANFRQATTCAHWSV